MSTDTPAPTDVEFETIDWSEFDERWLDVTRKQLALAASLVLYTVALVIDFVVRDGEPFVAIDRDLVLFEASFELTPDRVDWLFALTLLLGFWYIVVPLYQNKRMTLYYWKQFRKNKAAIISLLYLGFIFLVGIIGPYIIGYPELDFGNARQPPIGFGGTWENPLGTTRTGEDILQISVVGMRVSMQVGLIATMVSLVLATAVGTTAAFMGGWIDEVLMRFVDLLLTFPTFFLILFLVYVYGGDMFLLIVILAFTGWGGAARLIRSEALQRSEEAYTQAAESAGASRGYIIRRHIVPNVSNTVITAATLSIPVLILFEAVIAFLGFGDPNVWSWGRAISVGRGELQTAWWISTIPGIFLFTTVLAFNFLGDALRDALDPRHE